MPICLWIQQTETFWWSSNVPSLNGLGSSSVEPILLHHWRNFFSGAHFSSPLKKLLQWSPFFFTTEETSSAEPILLHHWRNFFSGAHSSSPLKKLLQWSPFFFTTEETFSVEPILLHHWRNFFSGAHSSSPLKKLLQRSPFFFTTEETFSVEPILLHHWRNFFSGAHSSSPLKKLLQWSPFFFTTEETFSVEPILLHHWRRAPIQARNVWKIIKSFQCAEFKGKWALTLSLRKTLWFTKVSRKRKSAVLQHLEQKESNVCKPVQQLVANKNVQFHSTHNSWISQLFQFGI